jgi:hypothetical protein
MYVSAQTNEPQPNAAWAVNVDWTDATGLSGNVGAGIPLDGGSFFGSIFPNMFRPKVGNPVTITILESDPPPQDASYDIELNIEKLTH